MTTQLDDLGLPGVAIRAGDQPPVLSDEAALQILAARINGIHRAVMEGMRTTAHLAKECGQRLLEAKELVRHGEWKQWLEQNTSVSYRTAARWMQIASAEDGELVLYNETGYVLTEFGTECITDETKSATVALIAPSEAVPVQPANDIEVLPPEVPGTIQRAMNEGRAPTHSEILLATRQIKRDRRSLRLEARAQRVAEAVAAKHPLDGASYRLIHKAVGQLSELLDPSIDAIITDPPYSVEYKQAWRDTAELAIRVLKPGAPLLILTGQRYLPEVIEIFNRPPLKWQWAICYLQPGPNAIQHRPPLFNRWRPILWFTHGTPENTDYLQDLITSPGVERDLHEWQQNQAGFEELIQRHTTPGALVLDPFCGSGTTGAACLSTGRLFIGADVDAAAIALSAKRLASQPEQLNLELTDGGD